MLLSTYNGIGKSIQGLNASISTNYSSFNKGIPNSYSEATSSNYAQAPFKEMLALYTNKPSNNNATNTNHKDSSYKNTTSKNITKTDGNRSDLAKTSNKDKLSKFDSKTDTHNKNKSIDPANKERKVDAEIPQKGTVEENDETSLEKLIAIEDGEHLEEHALKKKRLSKEKVQESLVLNGSEQNMQEYIENGQHNIQGATTNVNTITNINEANIEKMEQEEQTSIAHTIDGKEVSSLIDEHINGLALNNIMKQKQNKDSAQNMAKQAVLSKVLSNEDNEAIENKNTTMPDLSDTDAKGRDLKLLMQNMGKDSKTNVEKTQTDVSNENSNNENLSLDAKLLKAEKANALLEKPVDKVVAFMKTRGNNEIVQQAKLILQGDQKGQIKIMLNPKEFGEVKMSFNIDNEKITGRIIVTTEVARDAMQKNMDNLARQFDFEGYEVKGFFVSVDSNNSEKNKEGQFNKQFAENINSKGISELSNELLLQQYIGTRSEIIDFVA